MLLKLYSFFYVLHFSYCVDLTFRVEEGKSPGTYLGDIAADSNVMDDVAIQDQNLITFSLMEQDGTSSSPLFRISKKTGKLYTAQSLDAESLCTFNKECFLMVDVAVQRENTISRILEIKVIIEDVNDHQPEFPEKQVNIEFSEDDSKGVKRLIPNAIDKDVGFVNSKITYELKRMKQEPFTLSVFKKVDGTSDLSIILGKRLDREVKNSYLIQVIAKDGGSPPKESILLVHVSVTDVNDNPPIFSQNVYNVSIKNNPSETSSIATLSATDLDSGKNGRVTYHFSTKTSDVAKSHFKLNEQTGQIFLEKKFISSNMLTHNLYVEAKDGGSPSLTSLAMVLVNVINQQNNPPTIHLKFLSASGKDSTSVSEGIKIGSSIAYVKVTDHDVGQNGEVSCDLHYDKFKLQNLDTKKYQVIVKKALDRETEAKHEIIISCQDKGSPPLQSKSKFSIQVTDVNDVRPQFSMETFKFFIEENQKSRFSVGFINATDPDLGLGGKLTYSLLTNKKQKFLPFKIKDDGMISAIMSLDHEFQNIYKFQVFVKDNGIPSLNNTVNVIVEVTDKNDNAPYFTFPSVNPYNMDVVYYRHHSKNITHLKAADGDSQENAFLKYEIIRGNDKQIFSMNQYTGLLSFNRVLSQQDAGSYELVFVVKDSGSPVLSATTSMFFTLTVSNKTSEMLSAVHTLTEDKVDLTSVIIITVVAVTVAVIITASISVCIIRCNDQRNVTYAHAMNPPNVGGAIVGPNGRYMSDQRHLMCPTKQGISWPTAVNVNKTHADKIRSAHINQPSRESPSAEKLPNQQHRSASLPQTQTTVNTEPQVNIDLFLLSMNLKFKVNFKIRFNHL